MPSLPSALRQSRNWQHSESSTPAVDDELALAVERIAEMSATSDRATARILDLVATIPTGVIAMSPTLQGTVETSTSLTVATTGEGTLTLASMTRSPMPAPRDAVAPLPPRLGCVGRHEIVHRIPLASNLGSRLLATAKTTYGRLFGPSWRAVSPEAFECSDRREAPESR
jgi:hypothetical protein